MNKKVVLIVLLIVIIGIAVFIGMRGKNSNKKVEINENIVSNYNEDTGSYQILDSSTGEVMYETDSEELAEREAEFYRENSGYNPTPPPSPDSSDSLNLEE